MVVGWRIVDYNVLSETNELVSRVMSLAVQLYLVDCLKRGR